MGTPAGDAVTGGPAGELPLVGRETERATLTEAVSETLAGRGSTWVVEGPGGMGKTRLTRWLQEWAEKKGSRVLWGYALKEVNTPFFPFEQVFHALARTPSDRERIVLPSPLPSLVVLEEERPVRALQTATELSSDHAVMIVGRDRPSAVQLHWPALDPSARVLHFSREQGPDRLTGGDVDGLAERAKDHFEAHPGGVLAVTALDYLTTQVGFPSTLHLVEFLRDLAESKGGHVLLTLNPEAWEPKETALLESGGHVVRLGASRATEAAAGPGIESPTAVMIRYMDTLEREAPNRPLLLAIDDLQWADPSSLRAFQFLARNLRHVPVMLLATYRTDDTEGADAQKSSALKEVLLAMEHEGTVRRLPLGGISPQEALDLAGEVLGHAVSNRAHDEGIQDLMRRSQGNPYFLQETLRRMSEEGYVRREADRIELQFTPNAGGGASETIIPSSLRRLVARRLDRLSERERDVLRWAAVAGSQFDRSPLEGVVPPGDPSLEDVLGRLERQERLLDRLDPEHYSFGHPLVWEVTQFELPPEDRVRRSAVLATWWADRRPDELDTIARLYHDARMADPGKAWVRRAIDGAIQRSALEAVERYHGWLQDLLEAGRASTRERIDTGVSVLDAMSGFLGNSSEAVRIAKSLLALEPEEGQRDLLAAYVALNAWKTSPQDFSASAGRMLELLNRRDSLDLRTQGMLLIARSNQLAGDGRVSESERSAKLVLECGEAVPVWARVRMHYRMGIMQSRRGALEEARANLREALRISGSTGIPMLRGYCYSLEAFIAEEAGEVREHRHAIESAVAVVRATGAPLYLVISLIDSARGMIWEGMIDQAEPRIAELEKIAERFQIPHGLHAGVPQLRGLVALRRGRPEEAVALLEAALRWMEQTGDLELRFETQIYLGDALLACGGLERGGALADAILRETQEPDRYLAPFPHLIKGRVLAAKKDAEGSRRSFQEALEIAKTPSNLYNEAMVSRHLAAWEEAFGSPQRAVEYREEARKLFDRSGLLPDAWARAFPPSLQDPAR